MESESVTPARLLQANESGTPNGLDAQYYAIDNQTETLGTLLKAGALVRNLLTPRTSITVTMIRLA